MFVYKPVICLDYAAVRQYITQKDNIQTDMEATDQEIKKDEDEDEDVDEDENGKEKEDENEKKAEDADEDKDEDENMDENEIADEIVIEGIFLIHSLL